MSRQLSLLVVEGPHDCALLGKLLRGHQIKPLQRVDRLEPFWSPTVPRTFPVNGDLLARHPVPAFFQSATHSVAVRIAGGDTELVRQLGLTLKLLPAWQEALASIAIFLDADEQPPAERWQGLRRAAAAGGLALTLPEHPGQCSDGPPRVGGYVFPDNAAPGTLEDLLLAAGALAYPTLLDGASRYLDGVVPQLTPADLTEFSKRAGKKKALLGACASVLRPGKAVQNSIQDNRWLEGDALELPILVSLRRFLATLLGLPLA